MALTEKQVYNLGIGDEVIVHGKCEDVYGDGDIRVNTYWTVAGEKREQSFLVQSSCVSLPPEKPKHDPCRLFKKGDIVKTVKRWGRKVPDAVDDYGYEVPGGPEDKEWVVEEAEAFGMVEVMCEIEGEFYPHRLPFFHLELVTPVEELEPYKLIDSPKTYNIVRDSAMVMTIHKESHPHAKAAAEAECDRLNAEWRKKKGTLKND